MPSSSLKTLAMIGFGELGQSFCRDFSAHGGLTLRTYDIDFNDAQIAPARVAFARAMSVDVSLTAAEACVGADLIFSAVTADKAEAVAGEIASLLRPGQIYMDVNSASPGAKQRAAKVVEASGAHYVEGAVMGAVKGPGIKVEILAGGAEAARVASALNAIGMNVRAVSTEHGKASAIKLCRSIMIKGMEALMVDCARATQHWGVEDPVYGSLNATFPGTDWGKIAQNMTERVATHGVRRSAEMVEAAVMVRELGFDATLVSAVAAAQLRGAKKKET